MLNQKERYILASVMDNLAEGDYMSAMCSLRDLVRLNPKVKEYLENLHFWDYDKETPND